MMTATATLTKSQLAAKINERSKTLADLLAKDDLTLTDEEVSQVRQLNAELTDLRDDYTKMQDLDDIRAKNAERLTQFAAPNQEHVHAAGADSPEVRDALKSIGVRFVESDAFKGYNASQRRGPDATIDAKSFFSGADDYARKLMTTGAFPSLPEYLPGLSVEYPRLRPTIADLIPQGTTNSALISYVAELAGTNAAATVAEGALKPESDLDFERRTSPVQVIATLLPVTNQLMEDEAALQSIIDARLRLFIQLAEENQLVNGDGLGSNLTGILSTSGIQTQAKGADPTPDAIYKAMVKIQVSAELQPTGVALHPNDWMDIRLLKTSDGQYIWGSPADPGVERIWGLPVVATQAVPENTGLVAAWNVASQIFRRTGITFAVSDSHSDFFARNQLAIRAEERLAFVVFRPDAFCTVTDI